MHDASVSGLYGNREQVTDAVREFKTTLGGTPRASGDGRSSRVSPDRGRSRPARARGGPVREGAPRAALRLMKSLLLRSFRFLAMLSPFLVVGQFENKGMASAMPNKAAVNRALESEVLPQRLKPLQDAWLRHG